MGLGDRPRALQRAPTGFDIDPAEVKPRPSIDSSFSFDSDNVSPVSVKKAPSLAPTMEEEEDFIPKPLSRSATGWSEHQPDSDDEPPPPPVPNIQRLPEMNMKADDSPLETGMNHFLESEPENPNSFSAKVQKKMRADEGKALHEAAARRAVDSSLRDSGSSEDSFRPGSVQSAAFQIGTPPSQFTVPLAGKTPPRIPSREPPPQVASTQRALDAEDPHRSRARGPSPGRAPMPPGTFPLDTSPRPPSSSSSQYTMPSGASRTRGSPIGPADPFSATTMGSIQQTPSTLERAPTQQTTASYEKVPFSSNSQSSIVPTPPQFERPDYVQPPPPPPHTQSTNLPAAAPRRGTVNDAPEPGASKPLARSDTKSQAEFAFVDFSDRVTHMKGIFQLTAQLRGPVYDHAPMQWLRVAFWWFLRGRAGMETLIRSRPKTGEPQPERLTQPHVDLAKTWWIVTQVVQSHPSLRRYGDQRIETQARFAREAGDIAAAEVYEAHDSVLSAMKMLFGSMRRHQSMPPTQALIQGQDQSIWVEYPQFAPDAHSVLAGTALKAALLNGAAPHQFNPTSLIPLGDTKTDFCYFRMFVNASLSTDDPNTDRVPLPAVISVLRSREGYGVKLSICSQTELINVMVGSNPDTGPTWRDVAWKAQTRGMNIQLRHGFNLKIELTEPDFRNLWSIVDHTNRVESNLRERSDERLSMKLTLRDFSYKDSTNPGAFPPDRVPACKVLVFEKFERSSDGTGRRKLHRGFRLVAVTNTKNRTLSCVAHEIGTKQEPMNFEYTSDPADKAPGFVLRFKEVLPDQKQRFCTMSMVFNDPKERNHLFGTLTSMNQGPEEAVFAQVPLKAFSIESADQAEGFSQSGKDVLKRLQWLEAKAMNQDPEAAGLEAAPTVMSESLRIMCRHSAGVVSDRMNLGKINRRHYLFTIC